MDEDESIDLGMAVDEDEVLLADKQQGGGTSGTGGDDRPTESLSLNF